MGKQIFVCIFWLASFLVLFGCKDDDILVDPIGPQNSLGSCTEEIPNFTMLESSYEYIPYFHGGSEVIFQNETGEQKKFSIKVKDMRVIDGIFYDYNVYEDGDTISYCYSVERKQFVISNEALDLEFEINVEVRPYFPALKEQLAADIINIFYTNNQISPSLYTMIFRKSIDNRNYPNQLYTNNIMKMDMSFLGKEFKNVEHTVFNNPSLTLYFNNKEGIVAFENDLFGLYRFVELR